MASIQEIEAAKEAAMQAGVLGGFRAAEVTKAVIAVLEAAERVRSPSFNFPLQPGHVMPLIDRVPQLIERLKRAADAEHSGAKAALLLDAGATLNELSCILGAPQLEPFVQACVSEAQHQVYRWSCEHDAKKTAWDWFWTLGYLGGKAAHSALAGDRDKAKHHCVTAGALLANWHKHICEAAP